MYIKTYVDLTPAQEHTLEAFKKVVVRTALFKPLVLATFETFQAQKVKVVIDDIGVIQNIYVED